MQEPRRAYDFVNANAAPAVLSSAGRVVTEAPIDDFHLYDLHRTVSLKDNETKQLEFLEASGVSTQRTYEFDNNTPLYSGVYPNDRRDFTRSDKTTITIREEIKNTTANHLGIPLPAGRLRLYRRDAAGLLQFVGEGLVPHTPAEQPLKIASGDAFDLTGSQSQTDFHIDNAARIMTEDFAIHLTNQKPQPVTIHVIEHLSRTQNWEITTKSSGFTKRDSSTIDFPVVVPAKGETDLTYSVRYTW